MASPSFVRSLLLALWALVAAVHALEVAAGSSCATYCVDLPDGDGFDPAASTTKPSDIVCQDVDFSTTAEGIKYKQCLECLQKSPKVNGTETDVNSYLYNVRYTVDTCLFGLAASQNATSNKNANSTQSGQDDEANKVTNSPCLINSACQPLKGALMTNIDDPQAWTYAYCSVNNTNFKNKWLDSCISCLQSSGTQVYLSNHMIALQAGCEQQPQPGVLLGVSGTIFSKTALNITGPPAEDPSNLPAGASATSLTVGTIVGIAVGAALLLLGGIALFIVYWRKQRKYAKEEAAAKNEFSPSSGGSSRAASNLGSYIPLGHHTKTGSIRSMSQLGHAAHFADPNDYSNNADYYDKLEEEYRARQYNFDPHHRGTNGPSSALPTHPAYIPRAMSRQSRTASPSPAPIARIQHSQHVRTNSGGESYPLNANPSHHTGLAHHPPPPPSNGISNAARPSRPIGANGGIIMNSYKAPGSGNSIASGGSSTQSGTPEPSPPAQPAAANFFPNGAVPPPPPPPRGPKVPSLVLPSIPKIKGARKYSPPKIVVENATPIDEPHDQRQSRMRITGPVALQEQRFKDLPFGGPVVYADGPVRRDSTDENMGDIPIGSGKTLLYG